MLSLSTLWLAHNYGGTGFIGIISFIGILIFVQRKGNHLECASLPRPEKSVLKTLKQTMKKPINWVNALYCTLTVGPTSAFAALWGVKFLTQSYGITSTEAASALTAVFMGVACGSPLFGWWSDLVGKRRLFLVLAALLSAFITTSLITRTTGLICYSSKLLFIWFCAKCSRTLFRQCS